MKYLPSTLKRAIGACYCLDQVPSGERWAGVTITLRPRKGEQGTVTAPAPQKDRITGEPLEQSLVLELAPFAEKGVRAAADELGVDLATLDVEFSDFTFHPVDSRPSDYSEAALRAFRSAWEAWQRFRNPGGNT